MNGDNDSVVGVSDTVGDGVVYDADNGGAVLRLFEHERGEKL